MEEQQLLRDHGLRATPTRRSVLRLLRKSPRALSQQDVERKLKGGADRVTLFRVLHAFEEAGLAHKVLDANGVACYAACDPDCSNGHHYDLHAHFRCNGCGAIYCMEPVTLPEVKMPKGFSLAHRHLELEGTCASCS